MPGGDGTGPMRQGPMTGGGFGPCGGGSRGSARGGFGGGGGGFGRGFGRGMGARNRRWAPGPTGWGRGGAWGQAAVPWTPENEREDLQRSEAELETELQHLRARIAELEESK